MARHVSVSGNCPNTLLSCPFKDAGCDVKEKRHQLQKHLADSVVEHQLKQQQKISRLQDKSKELEQKLVVNAETQLKQQQKIFLLQYKNEELKQKLVVNAETQLKQQQKIFLLQYKNEELEQKLIVNAETQLKQQQLISELQAENIERKRKLVGNDLFNSPVKQRWYLRY
jgi:TNF receptor-associated factor 2/TNF receptor-associated factor 3/TNF receptor-associated factor 4